MSRRCDLQLSGHRAEVYLGLANPTRSKNVSDGEITPGTLTDEDISTTGTTTPKATTRDTDTVDSTDSDGVDSTDSDGVDNTDSDGVDS